MLLFFKYVAAAALSIAVQSLLTKWLAMHMHYMAANLVAIVLASVCNYLANDKMTFRRKTNAAIKHKTRDETKPKH
jgi:dolichol-phosphate mannosyltransferase